MSMYCVLAMKHLPRFLAVLMSLQFTHTILLLDRQASSVRMARNIQLVIKEETHADKVIDPAGGSYFMETLTSELVDKAWTLFLEIQSAGGHDAFITSGQLREIA